MKNMKISKEDQTATMDQALYAEQGPEYPSGLRLHLDPAVLKKLDLDKLPEVGTMLGLHATVEVVGVNLDQANNGGREQRLELQITDMELQMKSNDSLAQVQGEPEKPKTLLGS